MPETLDQDLFDRMVTSLKALAHPVRLSILRFIVQGPEGGTAVGEIQAHVGIPASTLSHHLACLSEGSLVAVAREGTSLRYRADFASLRALTAYLWEDCCAGGADGGRLPLSCCGARPPKAPRA